MNRKKKIIRRFVLFCLLLTAIGGALVGLYHSNYIPHKTYRDADFKIAPFQSGFDKDNDGIDDQTDILQSARSYTATKPHYKSDYYEGGYPDDGNGVCTDVIAFALLGAGYDLRAAVDKDIREHPDVYAIDAPDSNIDFRRVRNLSRFFSRHTLSLSLSVDDIEDWRGGDIVLWEKHIGIVSDRRNKKGIPFVIHHAHVLQIFYEEDILESYGEIKGHYRIDGDLF